jgi:DNA-binding MarR family transcriptional regulator
MAERVGAALTPGQVELAVKAFANRKRIQMLEVLEREGGMSVSAIADRVRIRQPTATAHARRLELGGLVVKRRSDRRVLLTLTGRGRDALRFCRSLRSAKSGK